MAVGIPGVGLFGVAALAGAIGIVELSPSEGPTGTDYEVTVSCAQEPTLTGRPLTPDGPPGTVPPVTIVDEGQGEWSYQASAGEWDDQWAAVCGEEVEVTVFDVDVPRLFLGPVSGVPFPRPGGRTTLEGTDCPAGSTVQAAVRVEGDMMMPLTATVGDRGDWAVDLPSFALGREFEATASCGSVTYAPYQAAPGETGPTDGTPHSGPDPVPGPDPTLPGPSGPGPTVPPAAAPRPVPGQADYTG